MRLCQPFSSDSQPAWNAYSVQTERRRSTHRRARSRTRMRCQREIGPGGSDVGVDCMTAGELSGAPVRQRGQAACQSLWRLMFRGLCLGLLGERERVGNGVVSVTVPSNVARLVFRSVGREREREWAMVSCQSLWHLMLLGLCLGLLGERESGQWCRVSHCGV